MKIYDAISSKENLSIQKIGKIIVISFQCISDKALGSELDSIPHIEEQHLADLGKQATVMTK
jgi:hypothetical protein